MAPEFAARREEGSSKAEKEMSSTPRTAECMQEIKQILAQRETSRYYSLHLASYSAYTSLTTQHHFVSSSEQFLPPNFFVRALGNPAVIIKSLRKPYNTLLPSACLQRPALLCTVPALCQRMTS